MKDLWNVDERVHIFVATTLGIGRVASSKLCHLYPLAVSATSKLFMNLDDIFIV